MSTTLTPEIFKAYDVRGLYGGRGEAVGGALDGDGVQAEAFWRRIPRLAALEELEGLGVRGQPLDGLRREHLDRADDRLDLAAARADLRAAEPAVIEAAHDRGAAGDPVSVFAAVRSWKDSFR